MPEDAADKSCSWRHDCQCTVMVTHRLFPFLLENRTYGESLSLINVTFASLPVERVTHFPSIFHGAARDVFLCLLGNRAFIGRPAACNKKEVVTQITCRVKIDSSFTRFSLPFYLLPGTFFEVPNLSFPLFGVLIR